MSINQFDLQIAMHTITNLSHVRQHNRKAVLRLLLAQGSASRAGLARQLNVSAMTATNLVNQLLEEGLVAVSKEAVHEGKVGRPHTQIALVPDSRHVIGVHIGIGTLKIALVDLTGNIAHSLTAPFDKTAAAEHTTQQIATLIIQLISESHIDRTRLLGIGIGASGIVDTERGVNVFAPSLGWHDLPLGAIITAATQLPTTIENNVRAMALGAAYFGQGVGIDALVFLYGRVGVGAGIVVNNRIFRGQQAGAGEIGHTVVVPFGGKTCSCGNTGCLETLIAQPVLTDDPTPAGLNTVIARAHAGDQAACDSLTAVATQLGIALANLVNTLNPHIIVLGGMYAQGAAFFLPIVRQTVRDRAFADLGAKVTIAPTRFGANAGVIGAAAVALAAQIYDTQPTRGNRV